MSLRDNRVYFFAVIVALFAFISIAHADDSASNGASASDASSSSFMSHMHMSYSALLHGPSIENMDSTKTIDPSGNLSSTRMNLDSEVNAPYLFNDHVSVSPVVPFLLFLTEGSGASLGDVGFKVTDAKIITGSNYNVSANFIVQLPSSDASKNRGMEFALKTSPNFRYIFQGTRLSMGAYTEMKSYLGVTSGKAFKLFGEPFVNYQLTRNLSLNVAYEMEIDHLKGVGSNLNFQPYQSDLMPGFVYMITPTVLVNPYLQIFTTKTVDAGHMALGAYLSAFI